MIDKLKCSRCGEKVKKNQVRFDKKGESLICYECYSKGTTVRKGSPSLSRGDPDARVPSKPDKYNKYVCRDCRYNFKYKEGSRQRLRCPYCGSTDVVANKITASELLKDSMDPRYDQR